MLFAIALGGAVGSVARFLVGTFMQRASVDFPYGTLLVNVTGSLLLGFLARSLTDSATSPELRAALTVGLCGGYTTFSTFSLETVALMERGAYARAAAYIAASVALSVAATFAGAAAASGLVARR